MSEEFGKSSIVSSLIWKFMERGGTQGIQFLVSIILARLLLPEEYGVIAIVMVFINLANVFVESGFNTALIQKKEADELDFSSVLYLSIGVASVLYIAIFLLAPIVSSFYDQVILIPLLRVLSLMLFIGAFNSIQNAYVARHMLFKYLFASSMIAVVVSGSLGIFSAYHGFGIWALVIQQISSQATMSIVLWYTVKWRPQLVFSIFRVKVLFAFGSKLLASALLESLYLNLTVLLIGFLYPPSILGYFNKGQMFPQVIMVNVNGSIQSVLLPALSAYQDNTIRVKEMMRRAIVSSSFLMFPLMVGLAVTSRSLVLLLLTERWLPIVPFIQIACVTFAFWPVHTANLQAINAMGRSDIFLKIEIIKKIVSLTILAISLPFGIYAIAMGGAVRGILSTFINAFPNRKLLNYEIREQLKDILPSMLSSAFMGSIIYLFNYLALSPLYILAMQVTFGMFLYTLVAYIFKIESFLYLMGTIREFRQQKKKIRA